MEATPLPELKMPPPALAVHCERSPVSLSARHSVPGPPEGRGVIVGVLVPVGVMAGIEVSCGTHGSIQGARLQRKPFSQPHVERSLHTGRGVRFSALLPRGATRIAAAINPPTVSMTRL